CAILGDNLIGLLEASGDEDIDIKLDAKASCANIKFSSGSAKIPILPISEFVFQYPEGETAFDLPLTEGVIKAIETCLVSVSADSLKPEFAGVTLDVSKTGAVLYSSDNITASRYVLEKKIGRKTISVVIPTSACQHLIKLFSVCGAENAKIAVGDGFAIATFTGATLITKLLGANAESFAKIFSEHTDSSKLFDLPEGLAMEIAKAKVVLGRDQIKECYIEFAKNKVSITATGTLGKVDASLVAKGSGTGTVNVSPEIVARALPLTKQIAINDARSLILYGGGLTHIISSAQVKSANTE
ncbi:MAG: hypothetical protein Q7R62_03010, partial [bacterium]|nr:hypothetical protein [bacterium]